MDGLGERQADGLTTHRYASFLLRWWGLGGDRRRIQIEHIQTGAVTRVATLAAAAIWMRTVATETGRQPPAAESPQTTPEKRKTWSEHISGD